MVKTASAVDWYAKEHLKLLVQLENKELTLGEYVVKHQDILQKAKSIEDLTSLKKRNTELQDQVLLNDTTNKLMEKQTAVEWLLSELQIRLLKIKSEPDGIVRETMIYNFLIDTEQAKQMEKEQQKYFFECGRNFQLTGEGTFEQYYNETYGKE